MLIVDLPRYVVLDRRQLRDQPDNEEGFEDREARYDLIIVVVFLRAVIILQNGVQVWIGKDQDYHDLEGHCKRAGCQVCPGDAALAEHSPLVIVPLDEGALAEDQDEGEDEAEATEDESKDGDEAVSRVHTLVVVCAL